MPSTPTTPDDLDGIPAELHSSISAWKAARAEADRVGIGSLAERILTDHRYAELVDAFAAFVVEWRVPADAATDVREAATDAVKVEIERNAVERSTAALRGFLDAMPNLHDVDGEPPL